MILPSFLKRYGISDVHSERRRTHSNPRKLLQKLHILNPHECLPKVERQVRLLGILKAKEFCKRSKAFLEHAKGFFRLPLEGEGNEGTVEGKGKHGGFGILSL